MILWIEAFAGGQYADDFAQEDVEAVALSRTDGDDFGKLELFGQRFNQGQQEIFRDQIDFGKDEKDGAIEAANQAEEKLFFAGPAGRPMLVRAGGITGSFELDAARGVDENQHQVARLEGFVDFLQHAAVKLRGGLVDARCIDENDLRGGMHAFAHGDFDHARNAIARGLRLGRNDRNLFAGEGVEQRAFAGVGPTEDGNKYRFQGSIAPD